MSVVCSQPQLPLLKKICKSKSKLRENNKTKEKEMEGLTLVLTAKRYFGASFLKKEVFLFSRCDTSTWDRGVRVRTPRL